MNGAIFYVKKGKIAMGENSERYRFNNIKIKMHAEIDALNNLHYLIHSGKMKKINIKKMDLIVIRVTKTGKLGESAPCYHCTNELNKNSKIKINNLYYSKNDGTIKCIKFDEWYKNGTSHVSKGWRWKDTY